MQYESSTSSVQARMCSTNQAHHQYRRGYAVRIKHILSASEDVQYKSGASSVQARICSKSDVDHQVLVQRRGGGGGGGTTQKCFPMNESLLLLISQVRGRQSHRRAMN